MQFKVGDKVRVRSMRWCDKYENCCGNTAVLAEIAKPFAGQVATITYVDEDVEYYEIDLDNGKDAWYDIMFEGLAGTPIDKLKTDIAHIMGDGYAFKNKVENFPEDLKEERTSYDTLVDDAYQMYYLLENIMDAVEDSI